ncbi:ribonuclease III [Micractinium conductrix]|uniref:Ribonuclease III n=1 Tax=Micractinium conductrix TaxID=554055 RepID=A0A2P6VA90_9CHLO|nr:ribonuclease III [Micractinium conductrix]|eukprot:PSC71009.1 ribonuclease III [Micractinium conductrix]
MMGKALVWLPPLAAAAAGRAAGSSRRLGLGAASRLPASAARRQLQPEAAYGSAALPLAVVPDERVQALLDKWQYAVAQQEMDTLEVRPPLWQSYRSAGKAAVASGASAAAATDALPPQPGLSRTQQLLAAKHEAKEQRRLQKLARKRVASAARKAKASGGAGSSSAQAVSQGARSAEHPAEQQDAGSSGQRAAQQQASGARQQQASSADLQAQPDALPLLGAAAASLDWEVCTVRGLPDGTTIFCFGDSNDAQQDGDATGGTNAERRKQRRRRLRAEAMLPYVEGQQFSSALRLGTLFPDVAVTTLQKLVRFAEDFFWPTWPPEWGGELHVSPTLASMLASTAAEPGKLSPRLLDEAGFDSQGRAAAPLVDLERWRVERLTLCPVGSLDLYRTAFTHKSALLPEERLQKSYERLEFLGDGVLTLTTRSLLMERRPSSDEGEMTKLQGLLVSGVAVARYAEWLGLERFVVLEAKAMREAAQHTPGVLGDSFEALLGALYLDQGFEAARCFCTRVLDACVDWDQLEVATDWKGMLSTYAAKWQKPQPRYAVRATSQREYKAGLALTWWEVDVAFKGGVMGTGGSFDKKRAEQAAARQALRRLGEPA